MSVARFTMNLGVLPRSQWIYVCCKVHNEFRCVARFTMNLCVLPGSQWIYVCCQVHYELMCVARFKMNWCVMPGSQWIYVCCQVHNEFKCVATFTNKYIDVCCQVHDELMRSLNSTLLNTYEVDKTKTQAIDNMQAAVRRFDNSWQWTALMCHHL